jgi:hypothetical protein
MIWFVRHHDRKGDRFDDDHGGCRRQPADKGNDREQNRSVLQGQGQHEHIAVDFACRKRQEASERDRHHEKIDQHQIDWIEPERAPDLVLVIVFDHGDMKLPRQQDKRHERQRHCDQRVEARLPAEDGGC